MQNLRSGESRARSFPQFASLFEAVRGIVGHLLILESKRTARHKVVGLADHTLLLSKDGKEFDIEDSAAPILTDTGERFGVVFVFRDITEKADKYLGLLR